MTSRASFIELYQLFEVAALKKCREGRKHFGSHGVIEELRFNARMKNPDVEFKICNDWEPLLARIFHLRNPRYDGFFTCKQSKFDDIRMWPQFARELVNE